VTSSSSTSSSSSLEGLLLDLLDIVPRPQGCALVAALAQHVGAHELIRAVRLGSVGSELREGEHLRVYQLDQTGTFLPLPA
jgi:hypothetical protein